MANTKPSKTWNLNELLLPDDNVDPFALVLLNQSVDAYSKVFVSLWNSTKLRVFADGGANRLYEGSNKISEDKQNIKILGKENSFLPDYIYGDLDSLKSGVKEYYEDLGMKVSQEEDQDSTDLTKCYKLIKRKELELNIKKPLNLIIHEGIGGRFDHSLASIQSLYKFPQDITTLLYSSDTLTFLLHQGYKHAIKLNKKFMGPASGLLPIGGEVDKVWTKGFKWNLDGDSSFFGGLVSTSNYFDKDTLEIKMESYNSLIFTCWMSNSQEGIKRPYFDYLFNELKTIKKKSSTKFQILERYMQPEVHVMRALEIKKGNEISNTKRIKYKSSSNKKIKIFDFQKEYLKEYDDTNESTIKEYLNKNIPESYNKLYLDAKKINWKRILPLLHLLTQTILECDLNEPMLEAYTGTIMVEIISFKETRPKKPLKDKPLPILLEELLLLWNTHLIKARIIITFLWEQLIAAAQNKDGISELITQLEAHAKDKINLDYLHAMEVTKNIPCSEFNRVV